MGASRAIHALTSSPQCANLGPWVFMTTSSTTLIDWLVDEILEGTVRTQDAPYVLRNALHNREAGERVWQRIKDNWDVINERFPSNSLSRMLEGITALDTDDGVADVAAFLAKHPLPQGEKQVEQLQERQRVNAALRAREADRLGQTLIRTSTHSAHGQVPSDR